MGELGSHDSSSSGLTSVFEVARNDIISEFLNITQDNGYRNDVVNVINAIRTVEKIQKFPEIGVQMGQRSVTIDDTAGIVTDIICDVWVQGAVEANSVLTDTSTELNSAIESIAQDILKVIYVIFNKYINGVDKRWVVVPKQGAVKMNVMGDMGQKKNRGFVIADFQIKILSVDGNF